MNKKTKDIDNEDITKFLMGLNDVGHKLSYFYTNTQQTTHTNNYDVVRNIDELKHIILMYSKKSNSNIYDFTNKLDEKITTMSGVDNNDYLFNIKVLQRILEKIPQVEFIDNQENIGITKKTPYYNPLTIIHEIIKIDFKFFDVLYSLNLHNLCKSPITGKQYYKQRTKINDIGNTILYETVSQTDITTAMLKLISLMEYINSFVTFIDVNAYNEIVKTFTEGSETETPQHMYGHIMQLLIALNKTNSHLILTPYSANPQYNVNKITCIIYNCSYGVMAITQIINDLLRSQYFYMILSTIFNFDALPTEQKINIDNLINVSIYGGDTTNINIDISVPYKNIFNNVITSCSIFSKFSNNSTNIIVNNKLKQTNITPLNQHIKTYTAKSTYTQTNNITSTSNILNILNKVLN